MTPEEKRAVEKMKQAIRNAYRLGIRIAGMDGSLLYATDRAFKKGQEIATESERRYGSCYPAVAHANNCVGLDGVGTLDNKCYEGSGGY